MHSKNVVVLVGRLVADPELKYLPSGTPVANFALAVNRSIRQDDGTFEDELDGFFDCGFIGDAALAFAEDFRKGALIQVSGSLHQRKFKVGNGAGTRSVSKIEVRAKTVASVLVAPKTEAPATAAPAAPPAPVPQPA